MAMNIYICIYNCQRPVCDPVCEIFLGCRAGSSSCSSFPNFFLSLNT